MPLSRQFLEVLRRPAMACQDINKPWAGERAGGGRAGIQAPVSNTLPRCAKEVLLRGALILCLMTHHDNITCHTRASNMTCSIMTPESTTRINGIVLHTCTYYYTIFPIHLL